MSSVTNVVGGGLNSLSAFLTWFCDKRLLTGHMMIYLLLICRNHTTLTELTGASTRREVDANFKKADREGEG